MTVLLIIAAVLLTFGCCNYRRIAATFFGKQEMVSYSHFLSQSSLYIPSPNASGMKTTIYGVHADIMLQISSIADKLGHDDAIDRLTYLIDQHMVDQDGKMVFADSTDEMLFICGRKAVHE